MYNDVCIIGGGIAGITAAIYLGRANIKTTIYTSEELGGNTSNAIMVQNFPGIKNIKGIELITNAMQQMLDCKNIFVKDTKVVSLKLTDNLLFEVIDSENHSQIFKSVIIATGVKPTELQIEKFHDLIGKGISFCALCDGNFVANKNAVVIGGGNTAISSAIYLSKIAQKVFVVNRTKKFRASIKDIDVAKNIDNIVFLCDTQLTKLYEKDGVLDSVLLNDNIEISNSMVFCCIGSKPQTEFCENVMKDDQGYIITFDNTTKTNIEGCFACGDCANPNYKQIVVAAGDGAKAAIDCINYLKNRG